MDTNDVYVGEHTPMVKLSASELRGFQQDGLTVRKGKSYTGRIVVEGTSGAMVKVNLVWGDGAGDRQTVANQQIRQWLPKGFAEFHSTI
jgi:alpha-N-arabinofuranosidase